MVGIKELKIFSLERNRYTEYDRVVENFFSTTDTNVERNKAI